MCGCGCRCVFFLYVVFVSKVVVLSTISVSVCAHVCFLFCVVFNVRCVCASVCCLCMCCVRRCFVFVCLFFLFLH